MRISKLEIIENPKIKNIVLDFKVDDNIQDTIILAGNNGCGKTAILEDIFMQFHKLLTLEIMKK